jgi:hypothetical protein
MDMLLYYVIAIALIAFAFRKQTINTVSELYYRYKEKKKHDEMMARLHRNDVHFSQKEYVKQLNETKKKMRKNKRERQEDTK